MSEDGRDRKDWAFALAPGPEGWRIKLVPDGARLVNGGGSVADLQDAIEFIASLTDLLHEDAATRRMVGAMNVASEQRSTTPPSTFDEELDGDQDLLHAVWEAGADAIAVSDANGIVLHANPAYCRLYGLRPEEIIGHSFSIIFPPEVRAWADAGYRQAFNGSDSLPAVETVVRRSDGTERTVESRYAFVVQRGRRVAMVSSIRDITTRRQNERRAQFRSSLVDIVTQPVLACDSDATLIYCNPAAEALCGRTLHELEGCAVSEAGSAGEDTSSLDIALQTAAPWQGRICLTPSPEAEVTLEVNGQCIRDDTGRVAGMAFVPVLDTAQGSGYVAPTSAWQR